MLPLPMQAGLCATQRGVAIAATTKCRLLAAVLMFWDAETATTGMLRAESWYGAPQIASLLRSGASDDALAAAWVPLVCSRLIAGNDVPPDVTKAARSCLNTPADFLRYSAGASESIMLAFLHASVLPRALPRSAPSQTPPPNQSLPSTQFCSVPISAGVPCADGSGQQKTPVLLRSFAFFPAC